MKFKNGILTLSRSNIIRLLAHVERAGELGTDPLPLFSCEIVVCVEADSIHYKGLKQGSAPYQTQKIMDEIEQRLEAKPAEQYWLTTDGRYLWQYGNGKIWRTWECINGKWRPSVCEVPNSPQKEISPVEAKAMITGRKPA